MILVKIERKDPINGMSFTNTGLREVIPDKEWMFHEDIFNDVKVIMLLFDKEARDIFWIDRCLSWPINQWTSHYCFL